MSVNDAPGGACMDARDMLAGILKRSIIHCYIQNMKALGLVVSESFFVLNIVSLWVLSVAMVTIALFRPGPTFPPPQ